MKRSALLVALVLAPLAGCAELYPDTHPEPLDRIAAGGAEDVGLLASRSPALGRPERLAIDLATALRLAGARDPELRLARLAEEQARNDVLRSEFNLVPTFMPFFRAFNHEGQAQTQTARNVYVGRTNFELQVLGVAYVDAGPVVFATLAAKRRAEAALSRTEAERQAAVERAAEGYLDLVAAYADAAVAGAALEVADALVAHEERRERLGAGTRARTLVARAERADRRSDLTRALGVLTRASAALGSQLQLDPAVELVPRDREPPLLELAPTGSEAELVARAWEQRPEVRASTEEIAARERTTEGHEYGPLVPFLSAGNAPLLLQLAPIANLPRAPKTTDDVNQPSDTTYYYPTKAYVKGWSGGLIYGPLLPFPGLFLQSGLFGPTLGSLRYSHDVSAVVGWNVGPGGIGDIPRIRGARLAERRGRLEDEALRARIQREVALARTDVETSRARLAAAREQVETATESARLSRDRFEKGAAIQLEVLEAERGLTRARSRDVDARVSYDKAQFRLLRALGAPP